MRGSSDNYQKMLKSSMNVTQGEKTQKFIKRTYNTVQYLFAISYSHQNE